MEDEELIKAESKEQLKCPQCTSLLHKTKKGAGKNGKQLALGVKACHDCGSTWLIIQTRKGE